MVATAVTLNDLQGHSPLADVFKCNPSNICAAFYTISTDSVLAWFVPLHYQNFLLAVTGGGSVATGETSPTGFWAHCNLVILLTYLLTQFGELSLSQ